MWKNNMPERRVPDPKINKWDKAKYLLTVGLAIPVQIALSDAKSKFFALFQKPKEQKKLLGTKDTGHFDSDQDVAEKLRPSSLSYEQLLVIKKIAEKLTASSAQLNSNEYKILAKFLNSLTEFENLPSLDDTHFSPLGTNTSAGEKKEDSLSERAKEKKEYLFHKEIIALTVMFFVVVITAVLKEYQEKQAQEKQKTVFSTTEEWLTQNNLVLNKQVLTDAREAANKYTRATRIKEIDAALISLNVRSNGESYKFLNNVHDILYRRFYNQANASLLVAGIRSEFFNHSMQFPESMSFQDGIFLHDRAKVLQIERLNSIQSTRNFLNDLQEKTLREIEKESKDPDRALKRERIEANKAALSMYLSKDNELYENEDDYKRKNELKELLEKVNNRQQLTEEEKNMLFIAIESQALINLGSLKNDANDMPVETPTLWQGKNLSYSTFSTLSNSQKEFENRMRILLPSYSKIANQ